MLLSNFFSLICYFKRECILLTHSFNRNIRKVADNLNENKMDPKSAIKVTVLLKFPMDIHCPTLIMY